jgi:excisionase family DNA binding protein
MPATANVVQSRFFSHNEVARLLGVDALTLTAWVRRKKFPAPVRPGGERGKRLYPRAAVEAFLAKLGKGVAHE